MKFINVLIITANLKISEKEWAKDKLRHVKDVILKSKI
jgi:hypothetical protein